MKAHQRKKFVDSRVALVRHIHRHECQAAFDSAKGITDDQRPKVLKRQLCFGHGKVDTCQGDSGGPVVCKNPNAKSGDDEQPFYLTGIVSYGVQSTRKKGDETINYKCGAKSLI